MDQKSEVRPVSARVIEWLKKRYIPLLTLIAILAIGTTLFLVFGRHPERVAEFKNYGYLGAFLVSLIGNATVLFPGIVLPILAGLGVVFYGVNGLAGPVIVGLVGGAGAGIGETIAYLAGYSGRGIIGNNRLYGRVGDWLKRWGFLAIFLFSIMPLFFDLVGLAAGALRFPLRKFILACWLGRTVLYTAVAVLAALGWQTVLPYFD
jgi:uncharacterized membrane protein YdjX (TVP38/TMEM64 family)